MTVEAQSVSALTEEQKELWDHVVAMWEMAVKQETESIREFLHPDYSGWVTGLDTSHDREAAILSVGPGTPRVLRCGLTPVQVTVFDHEVGIAHYRYEADVETGQGSEDHILGRWTEIYKRKNDGWVMLSVSGGPDGKR